MDDVHAILMDAFGADGWTIQRPAGGARKVCYIATVDDQRVFLAFGVRVDSLIRLADLGVAPAVLAHGEHQGKPWVAQRWIDGGQPGRDWIQENVGEVARLVQTYHDDEPLRALLADGGPASYVDYMRAEMSSLRERFARLDGHPLIDDAVRQTFAGFLTQVEALNPKELVPTHDEPNTSNMLVGRDGLVFVDWDDASLADPFRDIGPLMWWYLPEEMWSGFLAAVGMPLDTDARTRTFWFAARASLDVALWHLEQGHQDDGGFLRDFIAAVAWQLNPRG